MAKWMQAVKNKMKEKGTVGSFSGAAKRAGKSTSEFASEVSSNPKSSTLMKKRANLAMTFAKFRKH
jgi:hypothetical protein